MKQLLFPFVCFIFCCFLSCNQPNTTTAGTSSPSAADSNTARVKAVYHGIETGNLDTMDNFVAADAVDHSGMKGEIKGLDSIKKSLADMHNHIANLKFELITDATNGDYHFSLSRLTGTTKDNSMGMPANVPIDNTSVGVERSENGKVKEHWQFISQEDLTKMMMHPADSSKKKKM